MQTKLYVGNLSYEVTDLDLTQLFSQCGKVTGAKIVKDKTTGKSKGFGFVEMPNDVEADHAIQRMTGHDLKGRPISVNEAHAAESRDRNFGGGRGGH